MDTLSQLFSFQGRAGRQQYIVHQLVDDFVIFALIIVMVLIGFLTGIPLLVIPFAGLMIGGVTAATAVTVRRFHDLNMSGWNVLGMLVPFYNLYLGFKMIFVRGTLGPNRYGLDPLMPNRVIDDGLEDAFLVEAPIDVYEVDEP